MLVTWWKGVGSKALLWDLVLLEGALSEAPLKGDLRLDYQRVLYASPFQGIYFLDPPRGLSGCHRDDILSLNPV